jgi:hypothetical protein
MVILTGIGGFGPSALDHGPEPKVSEAKSRIRFSQKIIVKQEALALPRFGMDQAPQCSNSAQIFVK